MDYSICSMIVVWTDVVKWSKGDTTRQVEIMKDLHEKTIVQLKRLKGEDIEPVWGVGTGDGFGLAFPAVNLKEILKFPVDLLTTINESGDYKIRLSVILEATLQFDNQLIKMAMPDMCGPAVVNGSRLLAAIESEGLFIEESLAKQLIEIDNDYWGKRLTENPQQFRVKHSKEIFARRFIPEWESNAPGFDLLAVEKVHDFDLALPELLEVAKHLGAGPHPDITGTASKISATLVGIDRFLVRWMDPTCAGLPFDRVSITSNWKSDYNQYPRQDHVDVDAKLRKAISHIYHSNEMNKEVAGSNRPKAWLKDYRLPVLSDRPSLWLEIGVSDFRTSKSIQWAFDKKVFFCGKNITLREAFECGLLDIYNDFPGMIGVTISILTLDDCLIFAQRGKKVVSPDFAPGRYSPSCEEQWNPATERDPHKTVLRCLKEELNLDPIHGVEVPASSIKLVALGREWGMFWNTIPIYVVDLPYISQTVLESWDSYPVDRDEASAVMAVPIGTPKQRRALLDVVKTRQVNPQDLKHRCGAQWRGNPTPNELHDSTGAARILFALAHRFGVESLSM